MRRRRYEAAGLLTSVALHAAIVLPLLAGSFRPAPVAVNATPLTLAMFQPPSPPQKTKPAPPPEPRVAPQPKPRPKPKPKKQKRHRPKPHPKPVKKIRPKPRPTPMVETHPLPEPAPEPASQSAPPVSAPAATVAAPPAPTQSAIDPGLIQMAEARYKAQLKKLIEANKQYPRRARRLGQQGKALVTFVIDRNGDISQIDITRSSGRKILDQAVIDTIRKISGKLPFPEEIRRQRWTFTVPITFRLR